MLLKKYEAGENLKRLQALVTLVPPVLMLTGHFYQVRVIEYILRRQNKRE
jgi:hypothetical protein